MKFIIDSYAWIEYVKGSNEGRKVKKIIEKESEIYTLDLNIAEVTSKIKRMGKDPEIAYRVIISNTRIIKVNTVISKESGILHAEIRNKIKDFGLIDAYMLAIARKLNAKILTGDPHFKGFKEAIFIGK